MKRAIRNPLNPFLLAIAFFAADCALSRGAIARSSEWENSIVTLDITRKRYDYFQPWTTRVESHRKAGLVLNDHEILTTADEMFDRTLVRIQKRGRGEWAVGGVTWIDYHANLAVVTTTEADFFNDLRPIDPRHPDSVSDTLQILRWREGKLESRNAEFTQFTVDRGHLSFVPRVLLEVSSEIQGIGWGEPVISDGQIIGLATQHNGNKVTVLPTSFIEPILKARARNEYRGLGFFDFYWQAAINPATLEYLKLSGEPRGAIVIEVPSHPGTSPVLIPKDIILSIDGFDIDTQGDYRDPAYGPLLLENLATRGKWAGDEVPMIISRNGEERTIQYRLPKAEFSSTLVPDATYDRAPEYLIVGGFVFQPLNDPFLKGWGPEWKRRSPFRIYHFNNQSPTPERPSLVLMSQVLPDVYNLGYQDLKYLVVDQVNGRKIRNLVELHAALRFPKDGFHIVRFMKSDSLRKLVLSAKDEAAATQRVLQRYGIPSEHYIEPVKLTAERGGVPPKFKGILASPEQVTAQALERSSHEGYSSVAILLDETSSKDLIRSAADRIRDTGLALGYWIEIARNPNLAAAHPEWMASIQTHSEWRRYFPNFPAAKTGEVVKTFPWVPVLYQETYDVHKARVASLLDGLPDPDRIFLNDLQGAPSACGCGNAFCRWTTDYGPLKTATRLPDDAAAAFVKEIAKLAPKTRVIPVWTTECAEFDGPKGAACDGVACFKGACWKAYSAQLSPVADFSEQIGVLLPYHDFDPSVSRGGANAQWQKTALQSFSEILPLRGGKAIPQVRLISVLQGWSVTQSQIDDQIRITEGAGTGGYLLAITPIEQSWEPRIMSVQN